jgi:predicted permease
VIALRYLDLVLLAIALPVFLAAGLPMLGYAAGAAAWLAQRALQVWLNRRAAASDDPRTVVGIAAGSMIGRGWLVALTIFAAGLSDEDAGLAAAVLVIVLFTAYFTVSMIMRPFDTDTSRQPS